MTSYDLWRTRVPREHECCGSEPRAEQRDPLPGEATCSLCGGDGDLCGRCAGCDGSGCVQATDLMAVCAAVLRRGTYLGERYSAGAYTPAEPDPDGYQWCVRDRSGGLVVLAHGPFEAAEVLVRLESGDAEVDWFVDDDGSPRRLPSDAQVAEWDREDRLRDLRYAGLVR